MMKKINITMLVVCAILCMLATPALAQQKITGKVFNARTEMPVEGANIRYGSGRGTTTDEEGNFSIPCRGSVRVTISYIGYQTFQKNITDCSALVTIPLVPQSYALQKITVEDQAYIKEATSVSRLGVADLNKQSGLRLK